MTGTRVFVGPSLHATEARFLLPGAEFSAPVALGDVHRAVRDGCRRLVIIDGYFEHVPAVWHKEILFALSEGVSVLGAASMGALRAAELHPFGMVGVGEIFERYCSGALEADDEVAVAHAPAEHDFRAASDPLVNIRWGLELAENAGLITSPTREWLVDRARERFYPERTWGWLLGLAADRVEETELARLRSFLAVEKPDLKREDAVLVLSACAAGAATSPSRWEAFEPTNAWVRLNSAIAHA